MKTYEEIKRLLEENENNISDFDYYLERKQELEDELNELLDKELDDEYL